VTLEAVEAVCASGDITREQILDLLAGLVDKSVVQAEPQPDGTLRYRLLEPVRQYAWQRLAELGQAGVVRT